MSEKVHKRLRREARERARVREEQAQANRPSLLERLPSPSLGAVDKVGSIIIGEDWMKLRNRYFIPGVFAATVLVLASPALLPTTSYREVGRDIASLFQSNEPDYDALWERAEQDLYGRSTRTEAEEIEVLKYVQSGRIFLSPQHEIRELTGDPSEYGELVIGEETITNHKPNLRQKIREQAHYITNR